MRIVVSGATGYIGFRLISSLLKLGHDVLGIARKKNDKLIELNEKFKSEFQICELISDELLYTVQNFNPQLFYSTTCCYETDSKYLEKTVDSNYTFPASLLKSAISTSKYTGGGMFDLFLSELVYRLR